MNFIRALGLRDVVLMNIVAVVGMRWIARGARTGPAAIPLWVLAWIAFFVPLARITPTGSLLDVGCGSGVLAIAAARLGFDPITCVDVDPVAVETTIANAAANGVTVEAQVLDALSEPLPVADIAVANVLLAPVETILARVAAREAITSGYLERERPAHPGWAHAETAVLDGWAADRFLHGALTEAPSDRLIG